MTTATAPGSTRSLARPGRTNLSTRGALRARPPRERGPPCRERARSSSGPASTPVARRRTSSSSSSRRPRPRSGGVTSTTDLRGALRPAPGPPDDLRPGAGPLQPGPLHRRARGPPPLASGLHRDGLGQHLRPEPVPPADAGAAVGFAPELHDHRRPVVPGRSRDRGHPDRHGDPRPPQADGGHHRRDDVRRRDQEVGLHGHELPDAGRGRPADALVDQRRDGRRLGRLLRPLRNRQDHPLRRSAAQPDRR